MLFPQLMVSQHTVETVVIGTMLGIKEGIDLFRGKRNDRHRRSQFETALDKFEQHAASDNVAFAEINRGIAVIQSDVGHLHSKVDEVSSRVEKMQDRVLDQAINPLHGPYKP